MRKVIIMTIRPRMLAVPIALSALAMGGATGTAEASSYCPECAGQPVTRTLDCVDRNYASSYEGSLVRRVCPDPFVRAETDVHLTTSESRVVSDQQFTVVATITSHDPDTTPAGSVSFFVDGRPRGEAVTPQRSSRNESIARAVLAIREPGTHAIKVTYKGTDGATLDSQDSVLVEVVPRG
ncbi:Ig-like domain-containing protein [Pseudonocardia sp.]|jgi:hypothetical protein|uniref:Ig-like domain-containing protein n=1 Tax=Pseudonocardia sp. TaxID=60912 RepID=UPI0031FDBED3